MALLLKQLNPAISQYKDRRFHGTQQQFDEALHTGTTVYVGNLSFFTTEDQIYEVRRAAGRGD
jgi:nuclear cap-binding protein subunit 2